MGLMAIFPVEVRPLLPLYLTMLLEAVGSGLVASVLNIVARDDLGCSSMQVGILWSSYNAALILGSVCMGYLSDHIRRKYVLMLTLFWVGLGYILTAFSSNFTWFLVSRIITGLCGGSFSVAASILSANLHSDLLPYAIGRLGTVASLGFAIGPLISYAITSIWDVSSSSPFYVQRLYFFFAALIYMLATLLASRLPKSITPRTPSTAAQRSDGGSVAPGLCLVWSSRFFSTCGVTAVYVTQVFLWREYLGLDRMTISLATTASGLATSVFQGLTFPFLVSKIGFHAALTLGIGLISLASALLGLLTSKGGIAVHFSILIFFWFGLGCMEPGTPVAVARHLKQSSLRESSKGSSRFVVHTGLAMGITSAMKYAASLAVPTVAGYLYDTYKLAVYLCGSVVSSLGVVAVLVAWRLFERTEREILARPIKADDEETATPTESTTGEDQVFHL